MTTDIKVEEYIKRKLPERENLLCKEKDPEYRMYFQGQIDLLNHMKRTFNIKMP